MLTLSTMGKMSRVNKCAFSNPRVLVFLTVHLQEARLSHHNMPKYDNKLKETESESLPKEVLDAAHILGNYC